MSSTVPEITFIGFGEAAQAFSSGFRQANAGLSLRAYDKKTDGDDGAQKCEDYQRCSVIGEASSHKACTGADLIFSLVTADQAELAAVQAARTDLNNALYLDCNSCAPNTKRKAAAAIVAAGGRYVDVAIMTPVHPKLHQAPCLLAGPHARAALEATRALGMACSIADGEVGAASMRKMVRSVMIKGLEALTMECFLAARKAGIEGDILTSLDHSFSGFDWPKRAPYMLERAITHGTRRAAEMEEVARTLRDLGIKPLVTEATIARQREAGALDLDAGALGASDLTALTEGMLQAMTRDDLN